MSIIVEIDVPDDDAHDIAWPFATASAEFFAKVLGMSVSVSDGYGTTQDYDKEGNGP